MPDPRDMTYGDYLALEPLLSAQHPISDQHDELLFIVIHQTKELWLKQTIAELRTARALVAADRLIEVHKILSRVSRIQAVMTMSWDFSRSCSNNPISRRRLVSSNAASTSSMT